MSESAQVTAALSASTTAAVSQINSLDAQVVSLTALAADSVALAADVARLTIENAALDAENDGLTDDVATLTAQVAGLHAENVFLSDANAELTADNDLLTLNNQGLTNTVSKLTAEVAWLRANWEPKDVVPPAELPMLIGCNQGSIPGCPSPTQIVRIYAGTQYAPVTAATGTGSNWGDHVLKRSIAITFNDPNPTTCGPRIKAFLDSVPKAQMQGKLRLYVTNVHEAERGDKGYTPAQVAAFTKASILAIREWRALHQDCPNVWCNPNFMGWYERDADATSSTRDYWPKDVGLADVVLGVDPYDPTASRETGYLVDPTVALWKLDGGTRYMLDEINTKRTGTAGRDWWARTFAKSDLDGCEAMCLFLHATAGKDAPWTIDAAAAAEFDRQIKARPL